MKLTNPVIVVPGITASYLKDQYAVSPETVWAVLPHTKRFERVALHPDNPRYEAQEPARVLPDQLYEIAYRELIEELRYNLTPHEETPVPVYPFGYDWRQPLEDTELQLIDFIEEVIERTRLTRHYNSAGYTADGRVNLVGHSMGGLVIAGALERLGAQRRVDKVATLATPYQGSFEAVIKIITGTANLGVPAPSSREREAARLTPALYYLLPTIPEGVVLDDEYVPDLYELDHWQSSVIETIAAYVVTKGLPTETPEARAREIFQGFLDQGRAHRDRLNTLSLDQIGLAPDDWLCVAGINATTRIRLRIDGEGPAFMLSNGDRDDAWEDDHHSPWTGDGTVPIESALPSFLGRDKLVCVRPDDFAYWEIGDRLALKVGGFHGILPNMNLLHRLIVRHFTGARDTKSNTWGWRAPGADEWNPPMQLREKT